MAITVQEAQVLFSADGMQKVQTEAGKASKAMDRMESSASRVGGGLKGIATSALKFGSILGGLGAGAAIGGMVKMASDTETLGVQMKVLTGSTAAASKVMGEINAFAAETPFESMEISTAARQLLAFGGSADTVVDELRMLGDIAAGTGQPLGELSELYGKAKVQGRLFGEDINQLTGRGIPVIGALARQFGVAESEVKGLVEKGQVGFPELQAALASMTGDGGKFSGMMAEMSQTTAGKFSTFVDNVKLLGVELGTQVLPYANQFLDWGINAVGTVDGLGNSFKNTIDTTVQWFNETQDMFADIGTIAGVIWADMGTLMIGVWKDFQTYGEAALKWLSEAIPQVIKNAKEAAIKAPGAALSTIAAFATPGGIGTALGSGGLDNEFTQGLQLPAFEAPQLSAETQTVMNDIDAALAASRAAREADRAAANSEQQKTSIATQASTAFAGQPGTRPPADAEKQSTQRSNAQGVFNRVQETLANKAVELQKQQVKLQQDALIAAQSTAASMGTLIASGGFVPVLG